MKSSKSMFKLWIWVIAIVGLLVVANISILYFMRPSADAGDITPATFTIDSAASIDNSRFVLGLNTYDFTNTDLIIDGAVTVTLSGENHFKSLTLNNGPTLTHQALVAGTDFDQTTSALTASGEAKKVDIQTTGDLTINNGTINVNGKGFPGGKYVAPDCGGQQAAFGPGKGASVSASNSADAGGAGYYSTGGGANILNSLEGWQEVPNSAGIAYYTESLILPGSGGGSAVSDCDNKVAGGNGGGVIKLKVGEKFTFDSGNISANGTNGGWSDGNGGHSRGGGGSGGIISIVAKTIEMPVSSVASSVAGGLTNGGNGLIDKEYAGDLFHMSATGGIGGSVDHHEGGGGSGGVILVSYSGETPPSIVGDLNLDGVVDISDFAILAGNWGKSNPTAQEGDLNSDGVIDISDFAVMVANWS